MLLDPRFLAEQVLNSLQFSSMNAIAYADIGHERTSAASSLASVTQQVEALGIGLHQAVLDAVVHHLHIVPGADGAAVQISQFRRWRARVAARRPFNVPSARRERGEDGIEPGNDVLLAADHQAIAAFESPNAAGCADVEIVDALRLQFLRPGNVVAPERVAAVDQRVAGAQVR